LIRKERLHAEHQPEKRARHSRRNNEQEERATEKMRQQKNEGMADELRVLGIERRNASCMVNRECTDWQRYPSAEARVSITEAKDVKALPNTPYISPIQAVHPIPIRYPHRLHSTVVLAHYFGFLAHLPHLLTAQPTDHPISSRPIIGHAVPSMPQPPIPGRVSYTAVSSSYDGRCIPDPPRTI
jgi:hypothetical protein